LRLLVPVKADTHLFWKDAGLKNTGGGDDEVESKGTVSNPGALSGSTGGGGGSSGGCVGGGVGLPSAGGGSAGAPLKKEKADGSDAVRAVRDDESPASADAAGSDLSSGSEAGSCGALAPRRSASNAGPDCTGGDAASCPMNRSSAATSAQANGHILHCNFLR